MLKLKAQLAELGTQSGTYASGRVSGHVQERRSAHTAPVLLQLHSSALHHVVRVKS